jgi:predicted SprT family Zn-dependent metalloprotease
MSYKNILINRKFFLDGKTQNYKLIIPHEYIHWIQFPSEKYGKQSSKVNTHGLEVWLCSRALQE